MICTVEHTSVGLSPVGVASGFSGIIFQNQ